MLEIIPSVSPIRRQRRKSEVDDLQGDIRNSKPPTFDGGHNKDEHVEAWVLGRRKYF